MEPLRAGRTGISSSPRAVGHAPGQDRSRPGGRAGWFPLVARVGGSLGLGLWLAVGVVVAQEPPAPLIARGLVYHDRNQNRAPDDGEEGLPGVGVSNGRDIVTTGADGRYELPIDPQDAAVFVLKPSGWRPPWSEDRLPLFYYLHKPAGSPPARFAGVPPSGPLPAAVNFPLYPQEEPAAFELILFGDTQARNETEELYNANSAIAELLGSTAAFGVTLGDIVFDDLDVFPLHNRAVALIGIPWYNVIGNHDVNTDAATRATANETYERFYGPSYYSFDYGQIHFVVLDNIDWTPPTATAAGKYSGGFGPHQLEFLRNDLARIPAPQMVVLMMHIPLTLTADRQEVYRLLEQRPLALSIAGHTHTHEQHYIDASDGWRGAVPHHHLVNVTVCGSWWSGQQGPTGLPHAQLADGTPRGYSRLAFAGDRYELTFKAVGRDPSYQLEVMTTGELAAGRTAAATVWANVFNGSPRTAVTMTIDGDRARPIPLVRDPQAVDPNYRAIFERELAIQPPVQPALTAPKPSTHLWKTALPADLAAGLHLLTVTATDPNGRSYSAHRVIVVH